MSQVLLHVDMSPPLSAPPRPALAVPPRRGNWLVRQPWLLATLWAWPLILSLVFVAGVMAWLVHQEDAERDIVQRTMIADALSLESQISARLEAELVKLRGLADNVAKGGRGTATFYQSPLLLDGLRRLWISVTWLDENGRIVAHAPDDSLPPRHADRSMFDDEGLSGHLSVSLPPTTPGGAQGMMIARFSAAAVLRQKLPWWLASKYDIRIVDVSDEVIAGTTRPPRGEEQLWYRVPMGPALPQAWLELTAQHRVTPWWRTMPMALMAGFLVLVALASAMLRRQMRSVSRAETAWRTEVAWRSAMEDSLAVGIRARDMDGRLVYVNKTMADMVGYQPEELVGLLPPMPYWVADDLDHSMRMHRRNMAGQAPREGYESRWQHRDGHIIDVMVFEAPLVDAKGVQIGWMASVLNITEKKRMEERERRQLETMAHHARLTMIGEVASTLAHELNQPLSAIASYNAGVLNALQASGTADPHLLKALQRMGEQAGHAGRIVRRIREFLTRHEPQLEPCDLADVIRSGMNLLKRDIARQNVQTEVALDAALPQVRADTVLLEQVVVNLVRNACDALATQPEPRRIRVTANVVSGGRFVRVTVADNGPGLQGRLVDELCAPFFTTKSEGMGMGLAICRSIVELHYGVLDAEASALGGAAFSFSLPVHGAATGSAASQEESA
jgi:two-component system sensor histidine kinase DctS